MTILSKLLGPRRISLRKKLQITLLVLLRPVLRRVGLKLSVIGSTQPVSDNIEPSNAPVEVMQETIARLQNDLHWYQREAVARTNTTWRE